MAPEEMVRGVLNQLYGRRLKYTMLHKSKMLLAIWQYGSYPPLPLPPPTLPCFNASEYQSQPPKKADFSIPQSNHIPVVTCFESALG